MQLVTIAASAPPNGNFDSESLVKARGPALFLESDSGQDNFSDTSSLGSGDFTSKFDYARSRSMTLVNSDGNQGCDSDLRRRIEQFLQDNEINSVVYSSNPPSYHTRTRPSTMATSEGVPHDIWEF